MAKNPPSRDYSESFRERAAVASGRFWRNVVLIALAHVALIAGLIRWTLAARASSNSEGIVWLGSADDLAAGEPENQQKPSAARTTPPVEPKPAKDDEAQEEKPLVTTAKSEIELPSPTPKLTATATPPPKPTATATSKPKVTPKPAPKPTPKKTLVAKASPKPSAKTKSSPAKSNEKSPKNEKTILAKTGTASQSGSGKTGSTGKGGSAGGGSSASEFGWYGHMLHDRFFSAWIQPTTNVPSGSKISTLVKVRIEKDGRVSKFEIVKPSENVVVNESVGAIGKRISEVDPPPAGLATGDHYDVKINFELSTDQAAAK
jgi:outer membrane biosynthesis protein TonB